MNEQQALKRLVPLLENYVENRMEKPFVDYLPSAELERLLDLDRPGSEGDWDRLFDWLESYLKYGVNTAHPAFANRMWTGANLPSILAEMVVAVSNTSSCTYESAPVSTLFEKHMIQQMLELVGFTHGEGQMTTGSSNANMVAMMCARNRVNDAIKQQGLFGQKPLYAFVNAEAHYSMDKAANILGLGMAHLIKVPTNALGEMDPVALHQAIERVLGSGGQPFFVGATAGTTVRGAYDPIEPILSLRERYGFWLHVDGAWGGAAMMSDRLRARFLSGLSEVDSFTCDFHKMLGSALMCNILLLNHSAHTFGTVLAAGDGSYLFRDTEENDVQDLGSVSLQCGRRVDSLKWFLDWKFYGKKGFGQRVERYLELVEYAEQRVRQSPELELTSPRASFNLCFRYKADPAEADALNQALRTQLYKRGLGLIGIGYIGQQLTLRLLVTNTRVDRPQIDHFFDQLIAVGQSLAHEGVCP